MAQPPPSAEQDEEPLLAKDQQSSEGPAPTTASPVNTLPHKILAALFYALASIMIMLVNKQVLTGLKFPSFQVLGIGQMASTILLLQVASSLKIITLPKFSVNTLSSIWPLPLFYVGNMVFGLGGTKALSLPMLTVLRRFSILMTMVGEWVMLDIRAPQNVRICVFLMIFGAVVAAVNDLAFNLQGYLFVLLNDVCTAGTGVMTKKKLNSNNIGMMFGGDYIFSWWNFIGLTVSACASIMYTKVTFTNKSRKAKESPVKAQNIVSQLMKLF